jgi:hypothetical protein
VELQRDFEEKIGGKTLIWSSRLQAREEKPQCLCGQFFVPPLSERNVGKDKDESPGYLRVLAPRENLPTTSIPGDKSLSLAKTG